MKTEIQSDVYLAALPLITIIFPKLSAPFAALVGSPLPPSGGPLGHLFPPRLVRRVARQAPHTPPLALLRAVGLERRVHIATCVVVNVVGMMRSFGCLRR